MTYIHHSIKKMNHFFIILAILTFSVSGKAEITTENLKDSELFKESESSNGVGIYCINHEMMTTTSMVLMNKTQDKILALLPITSTCATDEMRKNWLAIKWNDSGTLVAIHDASGKHGKILIYHKSENDSFERVILPDMLKIEAEGRLGLDLTTITSSKQKPDRWKNNNLLMVKYQFKTKDGKLYRRTLPILIDNSGKYRQQ